MKSDSTSHRRGLAVAFALVFGVGIAGSHHAAFARMSDTLTAGPTEVSTRDASGRVIVVADKNWDGNGHDNKNGNNGNWNKNGNGGNRNGKSGNWNGNGGNWNGKSGNWNGNSGNNGNWKNGNNGNWNKGGNQNWNKGGNYGNWNKGGNKHWSNNNHWNNNWNKGWNNRAYMRGWSHRPYYGEFFGGVVLGSILAAAGAGIVPYSPDPELCWYWADPYMYRGYWDYCY